MWASCLSASNFVQRRVKVLWWFVLRVPAFFVPFFKGSTANYFDPERMIGLFSFCQDVGSGTDFLKNAITYGPAEGFGDDLWRVDDVSLFSFFAPSFLLCSGGRQGDIKRATQNC